MTMQIKNMFSDPKQLTIFLVTATVIIVSVFFPVADRVGDGMEYYLMLFNLAEFLHPYSTSNSLDYYDDFAEKNRSRGFLSFEKIKIKYKNLVSNNDEWDFNHFWFYSFLALPFYYITKLFGLHPGFSFTLLNMFLFTLTLTLSYREYGTKGIFALFFILIFSPTLWYINKAHTEFFTIMGTISAFICFMRSKLILSAMFFAIISTQNPPFAVISVLIILYWIINKWKRKNSFERSELILLAVTFAIMMLHPLYYFIRLGVPTPQMLLPHSILATSISLKKFFIWFIEPDIGLLPNWPLGLMFLVSLFYVFKEKKHRKYPITIIFCVVYVIIISLSQATTPNLNHGGTVSVSRYSLWYLFILFPLIIFSRDKFLSIKNKIYKIAILIIVISMGTISVVKYFPTNKESYGTPTLFSNLLYRYFPKLYNPYPEIFYERYSGVCQRVGKFKPWAISNPSGRKIFVWKRNMKYYKNKRIPKPMGCEVPLDSKRLYLRTQKLIEMNPTTPFNYIHLTNNVLADLIPYYSVMNFNSNEVKKYFKYGWSRVEKWGTWTDREKAALGFKLKEKNSFNERVTLALTIKAFLARKIKNQWAIVKFNNKDIGNIFINSKGKKYLEFQISSSLLRNNNEILFLFPNVSSPRELGLSNDPRKIGLGFIKLELRF